MTMIVHNSKLSQAVKKALLKVNHAKLQVCAVSCFTSLFLFNVSASEEARYTSTQEPTVFEDPFTDDLDDDFDNIDAKLEASFLQTDAELEARYQAVHEAIQTAFRKQSSKIEVKWPNDVVVPTGAVWVAYNEQYDERVIYDFEEGFFQLEVTDSKDMRETLQRLAQLASRVSKNKAQTLQSLDVFGQAIAQEVAKLEPATITNSPAARPANDVEQAASVALPNAAEPVVADVIVAEPAVAEPAVAEAIVAEPIVAEVVTRQALLKPANYQIMASVTPQVPHIDVQDLLLELERKNALKNKQAQSATQTTIASMNATIPPSKVAVSEVAALETTTNSDVADSNNINLDINDIELAPVELSLANTNSAAANTASSPLRIQKTENGWALKVPFVNSYQKTLINQRMQTIEDMSTRFNVDVSLILAIIEAESSFNPMATSHIPAFGLMQLVPKTAGVDAYRHVYGKHRILGPEYLYDVENNIELGTAYIDVLQNRYLRGIDNPENKLYSMIASYNTGVGNLANTVTGSKRIRGAIPFINKMEPQAYYEFLQANLPATETKRYLEKVITKKQKYIYLDGN